MLLTLWRRAPAWRLSLIAAASFTALAILFPPPGRQAVPKPSFVLPPDRVPTALGAVASPPPGVLREGVVPYAGRQVPLPAGQWQLVAIGRDEGAQPRQVSVLARVRGAQLGGLLVAVAPDALSQASGLLAAPAPCSATDVLAGETVPAAAGQSPFQHECWTVTTASMQAIAADDPKGGLLQRGFARLTSMGVALPERMLVMRYIRSTEFGWFLAELYLPARPDGPAAAPRGLAAWARRYAALLHRGYDGGLTLGQPTPALPREPG